MMEPLDEIRKWIARSAVRGKLAIVDTNWENLKVMTFGMPTESMPSLYEPVFGLVVQGAKRAVLGSRVFDCVTGQYIVVSQEFPVTSQVVSATSDEPFMTVSLKLKPAMIAELLLDTDSDAPATSLSGMGVGRACGELLEAVVRLLRVLDRPRDLAVLAPLIEREILWYLLSGEQKAVVREVILTDGRLSRISQAIRWIRSHYAEPFRVDDLAQLAGMSASSFHRHFLIATAMSPIQYQKQVRLQEARSRLMVRREDVASVGFAVGYDNPSQFSFEYSRLYGLPPGKDAMRMRQASLQDRMILID
jgi:AraC-like DNA-binding protein